LTLNGLDGLQSRAYEKDSDIIACGENLGWRRKPIGLPWLATATSRLRSAPLLGLSRDYAAVTDCHFESKASKFNSETGLGRAKK
jgi:hypothetical protein